VLPQLSVTVQVFVVEKLQPDPVSVPTTPVAVKPVLQLSEAVAPPKAAAIWAVVGLQGNVPAVAITIDGLTRSLV
jgi:hypothetical protein